MSTAKPAPAKLRISNDPMYQLLRDGAIKEFNTKKAAGQACDLRNCDFRGLDLRGIDAAGLDFSGSYFRQADLRGVDLREANLDGASINNAQVSGVLFPAGLSAPEIIMSLQYGTRMRYTM